MKRLILAAILAGMLAAATVAPALASHQWDGSTISLVW